MKHIRKYNEKLTDEVALKIIHKHEIEELCIHLKDEVDKVKIESNGNSFDGNEFHYNIDIGFSRDVNSIDKIVENAEKMLEITKEYTELLLKLEDSGYKVTYYLLETTQHINFYRLSGKIQLSKTN